MTGAPPARAEAGSASRLLKRFQELLFFNSDQSLTFLLVSLLLLIFVIYPFFRPTGLGRVVLEVFFTVMLLSGTFAIERPRLRSFAWVLAVATLAAQSFKYWSPTREAYYVSLATNIAFLSFATVGVLRRVFAKGKITGSRIAGSVAVYLLLGLTWAYVYGVVELALPKAFALPERVASGAWTAVELFMADFVYFSIVTLTTVGYGDITPVHPIARQLSIFEGLVGQLYPAILIARLVSLEITHSQRER